MTKILIGEWGQKKLGFRSNQMTKILREFG